MQNRKWHRIVLVSCLLCLAASSVLAQPVKPLTMPGKTALYQKVLAIPGSKLYDAIDSPADQAGDVEPFSIFYVYDRQSTNSGDWLQVGLDSNGDIDGWLDAFTKLCHEKLPVIFNALKTGRISQVNLYPADGRCFTLNKNDTRKFWRLRKPLQHWMHYDS